ncbi:MAG: DUF1449 family protein [Deltaproteobacteria bacterium]|nr:DUF1449 family protein [Deltaproteobacteria bacterium]
MTGAELFSWYGIGFVAVFVLGLVMLVIGVMGLGHDGDAGGGGDHDAGGGGDHDAGAADAKSALGEAHGAEGGADHPDAGHSVLLDFLGVGRCPMSILLMVLCFLFSLVGVASIIILRSFLPPGALVGALAYALALVGGFTLTGVVARAIGRVLPSTETYVEPEGRHVGALGKAVYAFDGGQGFIQVRDRSGTIHELRAVSEGNDPIAAGESVLVLDYDPGNRMFRVQKAPAELTRGGS